MILSSFLLYYNYCYVLFIASGTAAGYDNILPELLKHMGPRAKLWLTSFFSRIVHEKRIPQTWHQAKIIAIPKPGKDHSVTANYRPISLLSVCFKCLERLILQWIKPVLEGSTILEQAGFTSDQRVLVLALSEVALLDLDLGSVTEIILPFHSVMWSMMFFCFGETHVTRTQSFISLISATLPAAHDSILLNCIGCLLASLAISKPVPFMNTKWPELVSYLPAFLVLIGCLTWWFTLWGSSRFTAKPLAFTDLPFRIIDNSVYTGSSISFTLSELPSSDSDLQITQTACVISSFTGQFSQEWRCPHLPSFTSRLHLAEMWPYA